MNIRPATDYQRRAIDRSVSLLRDALTCAKAGDAPKLCAKIRRAIKSGGGAQRHAHHRLWRSRRVEPTQGDFFAQKSA